MAMNSYAADSLDAKKLAEMLSNIDPWPERSTNYSEASWKQLISVARIIQKSDQTSVEDVLRSYQAIQPNSIDGIRNDSKIYLLLRIIFELPESAPLSKDRLFFAGWVTMKTEFNKDGTVNLAWPLFWNQGHPRLVSGFIGLQGLDARYKAAEEYHYFKDRYPMRHLKRVGSE